MGQHVDSHAIVGKEILKIDQDGEGKKIPEAADNVVVAQGEEIEQEVEEVGAYRGCGPALASHQT